MCTSEDANRKATNVASIKGRARSGLLVRIFRRNLSLKVEERLLCCRAAVGWVLRLLIVGDEVVDVEVEVGRREREDWGVVTNQMIVFKIAGVGGSEKPAFKDIAICVKGRWHMETIAVVEARRTCRRARAGGDGGCDARSHLEGGA